MGMPVVEVVMQVIEDLLRVLEYERANYKDLCQYSHRKQKILLSNDIEGLTSITQDEERLIQEIQRKEEERIKLLNRLAKELQIPVDELNLNRLAELVDPESSDRLLSIGKDLKALLEELSSVNHVNSRLILDSLAFTTCILDVITQQEREKSTYKEKGQRQQSGLPLVVDRRV